MRRVLHTPVSSIIPTKNGIVVRDGIVRSIASRCRGAIVKLVLEEVVATVG